MKSPVQDESTNDLPVPKGPFVSKEKESDAVQGSKRMQQNPAKKELSHVTLAVHTEYTQWAQMQKKVQLQSLHYLQIMVTCMLHTVGF